MVLHTPSSRILDPSCYRELQFILAACRTWPIEEGMKEMFYLTTQSTHYIYGFMVSDTC